MNAQETIQNHLDAEGYDYLDDLFSAMINSFTSDQIIEAIQATDGDLMESYQD